MQVKCTVLKAVPLPKPLGTVHPVLWMEFLGVVQPQLDGMAVHKFPCLESGATLVT